MEIEGSGTPPWLESCFICVETNVEAKNVEEFKGDYQGASTSNGNINQKPIDIDASNSKEFSVQQEPDFIQWKLALQKISLHKDPGDIQRADIVGKEFESIEVAEMFFNLYGRLTRFSIRKACARKRADGVIILANADAARAVGCFEHKADHDSNFFRKFSYDEDRRLQNIVCADTRC
ncbi:hypothetical protein TorRG33x02_291800 [Trema orientale]|uniref:Uncharacterized protein n=1 Tax=Trema orientale TaxID=63057 RepID=A0A2P5CAY0_TREOI|nr:hypothetical protein TorRG33x02_291800 [Trema orientale]